VDSNVSAWTFGGSILSFAFPMILFIVVALALYVLYTKPEFVPGHRAPGLERPVSYTAVPGMPTAESPTRTPGRAAGVAGTAETTAARTAQADAGTTEATTGTHAGEASASEAAETEDPE